MKNLLKLTLIAATLTASLFAGAQEAAIRKNLGDRLPQLKKIDEVSKTAMAGLYEVRVNETDIFYLGADFNDG